MILKIFVSVVLVIVFIITALLVAKASLPE